MTQDGNQATPGERKAAGLILRLLGTKPVAVWATSSPDAKFAELPGERQVVVKWPGWRNGAGSVLAEVWAYEACRQRGIRVPRVVASSEVPECAILERLPGESIAGRAPNNIGADHRIWAAAGEDLRRLHEIRLAGFGPLQLEHGAPRGRSSAWCPFAEDARAQGITWLVDRGFLDRRDGDRLIHRFHEASPQLAAVTDGRLVHGDVDGQHLFSDSGAYRGMIDFGQAQAGDPRWDFARVRLWDGDDALDALLDGYGHDAVSREDREQILPLYLFAFICHHAVGHTNAAYIRTSLERSRFGELL